MIRTQIYLTEQERAALTRIVKQTGKTQSELIRTAIDRFCVEQKSQQRLNAMRKAAGIWRDRTDLPDFADLRREWDRTNED